MATDTIKAPSQKTLDDLRELGVQLITMSIRPAEITKQTMDTVCDQMKSLVERKCDA